MMKLSTDARSYAHARFCQQEKEINVDRQNQLRHILTTTSLSNPRLAEITDLLYEKHKLLMLAKLESYLAAYRIFKTLLDIEDEKAISNELLNMTNEEHHFVLSLEGVREHRMPTGSRPIDNVPQYLMDRFHMAVEQAKNRLQAGRYELMVESQSPPGHSANSIQIGGNNYGNIQQAGSGNTQSSTNRNVDEVK